MNILSNRGIRKHLTPDEFLNLADGLPQDRDTVGHVERCSDCRTTLSSVMQLQQDIADVEQVEGAFTDVDWTALRSSVRDRLLARAVERSSRVQRWTGWTLRPAAAWSLAFVLLVSGLVGGGVWHHRTAHPLGETADELFSSESPERNFLDESDAGVLTQSFETVSADILGWSDMEIFASLHELQAGEEEVLRELISLAVIDDAFYEEAILQ